MVDLRCALGTSLACCALLGCGSTRDGAAVGGASAGGTNPTANAGSSAAGSGGAVVQGGSAGDESGGAAGAAGKGGGATGTGGTQAQASQGYIGTLQVYRTLASSGSTLADARFDFVEQAAWDALSNGESCPEEKYGACTLTKCPSSSATEPTLPNAPSSDHLDAGTITMTPDQGTFSATGTPTMADHKYAFDTTGSLSGAELVTIAGTGGTVSAFSREIQMPLAPLLLTPSLAGSQGAVDVPVPRTADFTFSWDARSSSEKLQLAVVYPSGTTGTPWLNCVFDAAAGTGTFEVGALSQLAAGTRIRLFGVKSVAVETPQGDVAILAAFETISSDKASYPTLVLQ